MVLYTQAAPELTVEGPLGFANRMITLGFGRGNREVMGRAPRTFCMLLVC
jgi:hypothetical protein